MEQPQLDPRSELYSELCRVHQAAIDHAAEGGKGAERHADEGQPFEEQDWSLIDALFGEGFTLGQARKKYFEARRMAGNPQRQVHELLGAMNYLAMRVLSVEKDGGMDS
jgi:hypothetical protein